MSRRIESEEKCRKTQRKEKFGGKEGRKCEAGAGHDARGMLGSCDQFWLQWFCGELDVGALINRGSSCSWLDALEWWVEGGCCVAEKGKVWRGKEGRKCAAGAVGSCD